MTVMVSVFNQYALEYDNWFEKHSTVYQPEISELIKKNE